MTEKNKNALAKIEELKVEIANLVKEFNDASSSKDLATAKNSRDKIDNLVGEYANAAKVAAFEDIIERANLKIGVMFLEAVKTLEIEFLTVKITEDKDTKIDEAEIVYKNRRIDPMDVQKHHGTNIGAEVGWEHEIDRFGFRLALRAAKMVGMSDANIKKISDSYSMNKLNEQHRAAIAKEVNAEGNEMPNPISNTNMTKEMQSVVDKCIGKGYKITVHDVNFMILTMGKIDANNPRAIKMSALKGIRDIFMNVMSNLVEYADAKNEKGEKVSGYAIGYKTKKEGNSTSNDGKPFTPTGTTATTDAKPKPEPELKAEKPKAEEKPTKGKSTKAKAEKPKAEEPKKEEKKI